MGKRWGNNCRGSAKKVLIGESKSVIKSRKKVLIGKSKSVIKSRKKVLIEKEESDKELEKQ